MSHPKSPFTHLSTLTIALSFALIGCVKVQQGDSVEPSSASVEPITEMEPASNAVNEGIAEPKFSAEQKKFIAAIENPDLTVQVRHHAVVDLMAITYCDPIGVNRQRVHDYLNGLLVSADEALTERILMMTEECPDVPLMVPTGKDPKTYYEGLVKSTDRHLSAWASGLLADHFPSDN